jgi:hypothetical protein
MKNWISGFVFGALLFGTLPLGAEDVWRISPGGSDPVANRVKRLELAVAQLQGQIFGSSTLKESTGVSGNVTCTIDTPFDGSFSAAAGSKQEAGAQVIEKCRAHAKGSIYCEKSELKCTN